MKYYYWLVFLSVLVMACQDRSKDTSLLKNVTGDYLGQPLPDSIPQIFAPGIINTGKFTRDITMTPDGNEIWFSICGHSFSFSTVLGCKRTADGWTKPQVAPFVNGANYKYIEPFISPDGKYLYFASDQPLTPGEPSKDFDIWRCPRINGGWGAAENVGAPVNTVGDEFFPSVTKSGTIYYTSETKGAEGVILKALATEHGFAQPDTLPRTVNCGRARFNAFISPDERFLIQGVFGLPDTYGATDHYIFFRNEEGQWSNAINMGDKVNSAARSEYAATLSPDGQYLFFMSDRVQKEIPVATPMTTELIDELYQSGGQGLTSVYWMKSDFIEDLQQKAQW